jgi:hypothetical protein
MLDRIIDLFENLLYYIIIGVILMVFLFGFSILAIITILIELVDKLLDITGIRKLYYIVKDKNARWK